MASKKKPGATRAKKAAPGGSGGPLVAKVALEPAVEFYGALTDSDGNVTEHIWPDPLVILPHGFALDPTCSRCYATLPHYMRALGICGDCLAASQEDVRSIPGARYGR